MVQDENTENARTRKEKRPAAADFFDRPTHETQIIQEPSTAPALKAAKHCRANNEARRAKKALKTA